MSLRRLSPAALTLRAVGAAVALTLTVGAPIAHAEPFSLLSFDGGVFKENGDVEAQAGGHPYSGWTRFVLSPSKTTGLLRNVTAELPPGLIGDPEAVTPCPATLPAKPVDCPVGSQVGVVDVKNTGIAAVYRIESPPGYPAAFKFTILGVPVYVLASLRSGSDYGINVIATDTPTLFRPEDVLFTFWGTPADPSHDADRGFGPGHEVCAAVSSPSCTNPSPDAAHPRAFLRLPTSCTGPVPTDLIVESWEGATATGSFLSHAKEEPLNTIGNEGCSALDFSPTLEARPTTNVADSPSGLDVDLHIPQENLTDPQAVSEADLRDTTVTLPAGLALNPSAANGLSDCSPAEIGLTSASGGTPITFTPEPADCPDAAKIGVAEVDTPLLDHPVPGAVYVAKPYDNPFGSLLAIYLTLDDPVSGTVVKLAGKVTPDPVTGQLVATFDENPQLPFEDFHLHFKAGAHGTLRTPATCGTYATTSSLIPWSAPDSGPPATPKDEWTIEQGPGGSCAGDASSLPNAPSFEAGTASPIAGASTPLVVNLRRDDATQQFRSITLTPPQGLVGKLAGIPSCSESALAAAAAKAGHEEEASQSCPQASYVGSVTAAAGAGPAPYYAPGKAYLAGPYKGAPLSLAIVTPATAGPFDLGTIVVRTALYVDKATAQITAVSDPIPTILQGIPLDIRSVQVKLDRPSFTLNPTSCDPNSFNGRLLSVLGQSALLQSRFQVGECGRLGFKPKLTLALKGGVKRSGHPALTATLQMPEGNANLASISVALPHSEFLAQEHIRTVCTRVQFAAHACPAASVYGIATVTTPLLDYPLTGPVYLRSSSNKLPDLVPDLLGPASQPIELESDGRVDSFKGGIRNTFDFIPDAPFTKLVLKMQGGNKGLLVNSVDICKKPNRATVTYTAHNGSAVEGHPLLKPRCPKHGTRSTRHHHSRGKAKPAAGQSKRR